MSQATRAALHRTIRRSCKNAEEGLNNAERKVNHAMRRQFLNPDLELDDEERQVMEAWFTQNIDHCFEQLRECLTISRLDVVRFRAQLAAELQIDARLKKEREHDNHAAGQT